MVLHFFDNTQIFPSVGVFEIPVFMILDEVINFTCPCILKIIDNQLALGGVLYTSTQTFNAVLLGEGLDSLACGGIVLMPGNDVAAQRGK